jgi:hypothetical protein
VSSTEHPTVQAAKRREARTAPAERRARGVVHTPFELARAALARVDEVLVKELGLARGLGDGAALLLDPAVGTGVWLAAALEQAGARGEPRTLWGFDLDAPSLEQARALLEPAARAQGATLTLRQVNTLAVADPWPPGARGVRVIVGNPPWSARSASRGSALSDAWLAEFRRDLAGNPLGERRVGVLSDDYVRFFRWALEQARSAPAGAVLCFASNASFLDGPVHRGMRAALRAAFDRIDVIDLGGNALLSRGAERDANLFGVRVGTALTLAVRLPGAHARRAEVRLARLRGTRRAKLEALRTAPLEPLRAVEARGTAREQNDVDMQAAWRRSEPAARAERPDFSLAEAFPFHREGVQTNRDALAIAPTAQELRARLQRVADGREPLRAAPHFDVRRAREVIARALEADACIRRLAYRPLDTRFVCTVAPLCHRPRPELLRAVDRSSLSLLSVRKDRGSAAFSLFAAARDAADACFLSTRSSCRTRMFPSHDPSGAVNLSPAVRDLFARLGAEDPALVIAYALGLLCSARYRSERGDALRGDYPRILVPPDRATLEAFAEAGRGYVEALCGPAPEAPPPPQARDILLACVDRVPWASLRHCPDSGEVRVDGACVIEGVSHEVWEASVGHVRLRDTARTVEARGAARVQNSDGCVSLERLGHAVRVAGNCTRAVQLADIAFHRFFG